MKYYDAEEMKQLYAEDAAVVKFLTEKGSYRHDKMIVAMLWRIAKALEKK